MTSPRVDPEGDRAVAVLRGLQQQRQTTIAVPGRQIDRFLARVIDGVLFGIITYAIVFLATIPFATSGDEDDVNLFTALSGLNPEVVSFGPGEVNPQFFGYWGLILGVVLLYEAGCTAIWGATPGKKRTQLRIVDAIAFQPALPPKLLVRTLIWAVPLSLAVLTWFYSIIFAWGALALIAGMYCWRFREDSANRPLWDVLAGTHVITTDYERDLS